MEKTSGPPFLTKVGVMAGGVAALAFFALWPIYEALQGEQQVHVTFKGILLGAMLTSVGLNLVLLGDKGIPGKRRRSSP